MVKRPRLVDIINGKCIKEDVYKFFKDDKTEDPSEIEANDPKEADDKIKRITGQDPTKVTKWKDDDEEGALGEADNVFQSKLNDIFETSDSMYDDEFDLVEDFNTTSNLDGGEGQPRTPFAFRKKRIDENIVREISNTKPKTWWDFMPYNEMVRLPLSVQKMDGKQLRDLLAQKTAKRDHSMTGRNDKLRLRDEVWELEKAVKACDQADEYNKGIGDSKLESISPGDKKLIPLNEVNYNEWVEDDSATPKQKINKALWEISKGLYEFDRLLNRAKKLKNEIGADQTVYWKRTSEKFSKINERLLKVSSKIREMNQC